MDIANVLFGFSAQRLARTPSKSLPSPVLGCPCHWGFTHQLQLALAMWWRRLPGSPALFCGSLSSQVALLPMEPGLLLSVLPSAPSANTCDISISFTSALSHHLGYSGSVVTRTRDLRGLRALLASKSPAAGSPRCVASACGHCLLHQHLLELHGVGGSRVL